MKTADKYRFSLQWGAESEEKAQAGEFLESLGNRKSELVVLAVTEYLDNHPEILRSGGRRETSVKPGLTLEQVRTVVQTMIEEKLSGVPVKKRESTDASAGLPVNESDLNEMLNNLDLFS